MKVNMLPRAGDVRYLDRVWTMICDCPMKTINHSNFFVLFCYSHHLATCIEWMKFPMSSVKMIKSFQHSV